VFEVAIALKDLLLNFLVGADLHTSWDKAPKTINFLQNYKDSYPLNESYFFQKAILATEEAVLSRW